MDFAPPPPQAKLSLGTSRSLGLALVVLIGSLVNPFFVVRRRAAVEDSTHPLVAASVLPRASRSHYLRLPHPSGPPLIPSCSPLRNWQSL